MSKINKLFILVPLIALCLCGCNNGDSTTDIEESETTQEDETVYAYALVGDFYDNETTDWNESPDKDSNYYLGYDKDDESTKYWERTVTMTTGISWTTGFRVVEWGTWTNAATYQNLDPASTGVSGEGNDHNISVEQGQSYKVSIDLRAGASILVQKLDEDGNPILPNYDSAYVVYGDIEGYSYEASPNEDSVIYLAYDSTINTSKYWSITVKTPSSTPSGTASFKVIEYGDETKTVVDYSALDSDNSSGVLGGNSDGTIRIELDTSYDIIINCRDKNPSITINYEGTVLESDFYPDIARFDTISGIGKIQEIADNDDYIMGMDISSIIEVEEAGGKFYDYNGNEVDLFTFLASQGVNYIRIRLWNDPYVTVNDPSSGSFQGGGNDVETDIKIAKRAVEAGMKVNLDFHYSDFWADPGKYTRPRSWQNLSDSAVISTAAEWTTEVLKQFQEADCTPSMVQIGNEINGGIAGFKYDTTANSNYLQFITACDKAVKDFDSSIETCIHFASSSGGDGVYKALEEANVDFDVIGLSYYPYYQSHGTLTSLKSYMDSLAKDFPDKGICIAEYSYAWTLETKWQQGYGTINNIFGSQNYCDIAGYPASVQGQAQCIYDINEAVAGCKNGVGAFYWEPAWLAREGTSWASTDAHEYLLAEGDAGGEGSTSWSNQALFDYEGYALQSLTVFELMKSGDTYDEHYARGTTEFTGIVDSESNDRASYLQKSTTITSDLGRTHEVDISWNQDSLDELDKAVLGDTLTLKGSFTYNGTTVEVTGNYTLTHDNPVRNGSFEYGTTTDSSADWTMSKISGSGDVVHKYNNDGNAHTGTWYYNPYSASAYDCKITQDIVIEAGTYTFSYNYRSENGNNIEFTLFVNSGESRLSTQTAVGGNNWSTWHDSSLTFTVSETTTITVGIEVNGQGDSWAHIDDLAIYPVTDN